MERDPQQSYPLVRKLLAEREASRETLDDVERERDAEGRQRDAQLRQAEARKAASGSARGR